MLDLRNKRFLELTSIAICERLIEAGLKRKFISTDDSMRQIGKTTALIEFAKEYGFGVILPYTGSIEFLKEQHGYELIFRNSISLVGKKLSFVFDEGVHRIDLHPNLDIVTGFVYE